MNKVEGIGTVLFCTMLGLPLVWGPGGTARAHGADEAWVHAHVDRDLAEIQADTLRVLVLHDPLTWEERPGAVSGLEWDLLSRFAHQQHLVIKAIPVDDRMEMLTMLQEGKGDVIAAQLSAKSWTSRFTAHTQPYRSVVRCRAWPRIPAGAETEEKDHRAGDTLLVSAWSPFLDKHQHLTGKDSSLVVQIVDSLPEALLIRAALGHGPDLVVSDATASMEAKRLPLVRFGKRQGNAVPLVFSVRRNAHQLLHALDQWLSRPEENTARQHIIAAYERGLDDRGKASHFKVLAFGGDTISPFDSLFQAHADSLVWDWKLLAAVAFAESGFDTAATSRAGASGLMQMMPATATSLGVPDSAGLDGHIRGASRYLSRLDEIWRREIPQPAQRLKFVLAAYNAGPGHVKDAQRLAKELGLDPDRWDGQTARAMVLLNRPEYFTLECAKTGYCRGQDTYWYVGEVVRSYNWLRGRKPQ